MGMAGAIAIALAIGTLGSFLEKKEQEDRKKNPEKWAQLDAERWDREALKYWNKYCAAMQRIPRSQWILMDREEKSRVFEGREKLKAKYRDLPEEVKVRLQKRYKIDTSFRGV